MKAPAMPMLSRVDEYIDMRPIIQLNAQQPMVDMFFRSYRFWIEEQQSRVSSGIAPT